MPCDGYAIVDMANMNTPSVVEVPVCSFKNDDQNNEPTRQQYTTQNEHDEPIKDSFLGSG